MLASSVFPVCAAAAKRFPCRSVSHRGRSGLMTRISGSRYRMRCRCPGRKNGGSRSEADLMHTRGLDQKSNPRDDQIGGEDIVQRQRRDEGQQQKYDCKDDVEHAA